MLKFLCLRGIVNDAYQDAKFRKYIESHYDDQKILSDYEKLGVELLNDYALNNTEKSD